MADGLILAFSLSALRRVADPEAVFADAASWSTSVGIVTDRPPHVLTKFTRDHYIQQDFTPEPALAADTLEHVQAHHDTDRHLVVGATDADRAAAAAAGWEYLDVTEAAEGADWVLADADGPADTRVETSNDDWP